MRSRQSFSSNPGRSLHARLRYIFSGRSRLQPRTRPTLRQRSHTHGLRTVPAHRDCHRASRPHAANVIGALVVELFSGRSSVYRSVHRFHLRCRSFGSAGGAPRISLRHEGRPRIRNRRIGPLAVRLRSPGHRLHRGLWMGSGPGGSRGESCSSGGQPQPPQRETQCPQLLLECGRGVVPLSDRVCRDQTPGAASAWHGCRMLAAGAGWHRDHARIDRRTCGRQKRRRRMEVSRD